MRKLLRLNIAIFITSLISTNSYIPLNNCKLLNKTNYSICSNIKSSNLINEISFINSDTAKNIDISLMSKGSFSIDQLMELAGYSVACSVNSYISNYLTNQLISQVDNQLVNHLNNKQILIICGPGNNGGDGLVAARHLKHFGYNVNVIYLSMSKSDLYNNLINQCKQLDISIFTTNENIEELMNNSDIIIDSIFGFSFKGLPREPYNNIIKQLSTSTKPVISVDIPSGWDVELGDINNTGFVPNAVISLTVPKLCMKGYKGKHYVGGRFVPPYITDEFSLVLPKYEGTNQIVELVNDSNESINTSSDKISVIFVTVSNIVEAENIANVLVKDRLAACVNIIPSIISIYEWKGNIESSNEVILKIKTKTDLVTEVTSKIKSIHSYDVPEILSIETSNGNQDYIDWVKSNTK